MRAEANSVAESNATRTIQCLLCSETARAVDVEGADCVGVCCDNCRCRYTVPSTSLTRALRNGRYSQSIERVRQSNRSNRQPTIIIKNREPWVTPPVVVPGSDSKWGTNG